MTKLVLASDETIVEAAMILKNGGLVAFPTETVYGLGANALCDKAVAGIFEAKQRPSFNPLISHVLDIEQAGMYVALDDRACALADVFWPGPLSLILPRVSDCTLSTLACAGLSTAAVRAPAHPVARKVIEAAGVPIVAPSANRSGTVSPTSPKHVMHTLNGRVDMVLAAGPCDIGLESTVLDLSEEEPVLLRPGAISRADVERVLGCSVRLDFDIKQESDEVRSPGQLLRHYAPAKPLRLNAIDIAPGEALLAFGSVKFMGIQGGGSATDLEDDWLKNLSEGQDLYEAAANLFAMLQELDASQAQRIAVMNIPDEGLGVAINDRLRRAAQFS